MIKVSAGHYRDTFGRRVYDVRRARTVLATRTEVGWEYVIDPRNSPEEPSGWVSAIFPTKQRAAAAARRHLAQQA